MLIAGSHGCEGVRHNEVTDATDRMLADDSFTFGCSSSIKANPRIKTTHLFAQLSIQRA